LVALALAFPLRDAVGKKGEEEAGARAWVAAGAWTVGAAEEEARAVLI
jgi:hypothetical protein